MSNAKHTPRPWHWDAGDPYLRMGGIMGPDGEWVCHFGDYETYYPTAGDPPSDADRALMLAAPDLLSALRELVYQRSGEGYNSDPVLIAAREAIAKAKGRP